MTINRIHLIALLTCLIPGMGVHGAGREKPNLVAPPPTRGDAR